MDIDVSKSVEEYTRLQTQQNTAASSILTKTSGTTARSGWINSSTSGVVTAPAVNNPISVKNALRAVLESHKRRIEAIEWFIVHLGLDEPPAGSLVNDIIYAGIQALEQRKII